MFDFKIKLAGLVVRMLSRHAYTKEFCSQYITDEDGADITAAVTDEDIRNEAQTAESSVSEDYAESICLYRSIAEQLPEYNRFVIHGATISYGGKAYLFTAPSGTGKTTHIKLWFKHLKGRVDIINGDKPIFEIRGSGVTAYGTPYAGKERWQKNVSAPLGAVCIIKQAKANKIYKVNPLEYLPVILHQVYMPKDKNAAQKTLELFGVMLRTVPFYVLECDMSEEALKTSFEALTGEKYLSEGK